MHDVNIPQCRRLAWQRRGKSWLLTHDRRLVAFIERDCSRWLCFTSEDTGDDGFIGPMRTLAAAKRYLERRAAFSAIPDTENEFRPL